jgi:hypothetical protein
MLSLEEAKSLVAKGNAVGVQFTNKKGSVGTIIAEKSPRGKVQARMTCIEPGCNNTHVREISDWHQCCRCNEHTGGKGVKAFKKIDPATRSAVLRSIQDRVREIKEKYSKKV